MTTQLKTAYAPVIEMMLLTTCLGDTIDLTTQLVNLSVYEDIFSPVLTAEATIYDNIGLFDNLPISGNETLTILFYSYGYSSANIPVDFIHRTMDVIQVKDITNPTDYVSKYTLVLASPEFKKNEQIKISTAYQNTTLSNVINQVMTNKSALNQGLDFPQANPQGLEGPFAGNDWIGWGSPYIIGNIEAQYQVSTTNDSLELFIEKTKYQEPWVTLPYMKPFDIIRWIASRSIRQAQTPPQSPSTTLGTAANFVFFENKRGFQFVSMNTLLEANLATDNNISTFSYGTAAQNIGATSASPNTIGTGRTVGGYANFDVVETLKIENCYNIITNINSGLYASRLQTYDMTTGQVITQDYDYLANYPQDITVDRSPTTKDFPLMQVDANGKNPLTQTPLAKRMLVPLFPSHDFNNTTSDVSMTAAPNKLLNGPQEYLQNRIAQLSKLSSFKITCVIPANSKHKVGDLVHLDIKQWMYSSDASPTVIQNIKHKYYNGMYLITAITHIVSNTEYVMIVELVKDSITAKISTSDQNTTSTTGTI